MFILYVLALVSVAELTAFALFTAQGRKPKAAILNLPLLKQRLAFRKAVLDLMMRHYTSVDANLGHRMKANTKPFRLLHRLPGNKKRFKEVNIKNFFEFRTDAHGFIANSTGQQRDYVALANDASVYKILVCGNSVTTGYGVKSVEFNWPAVLEQSLNANPALLPAGFRAVAVINSAALGSHPVQELRRFQDETIFLNPNLVLLFSGGAMQYDYRGNPVDLGFHEQQKQMNAVFNAPWYTQPQYLFPNLTECLRRALWSEAALADAFPYRRDDYLHVTAAQYNLSKIRQFKGMCDTHGANFLFFLQPLMGVGKKPLTKQEQTLATHFERYFFNQNWENYLRIFNAYLAELRPQLTAAYQYDFMDIFQDVAETVYCDPRHHNEQGHALIAQRVEEVIRQHWHAMPKMTPAQKPAEAAMLVES